MDKLFLQLLATFHLNKLQPLLTTKGGLLKLNYCWMGRESLHAINKLFKDDGGHDGVIRIFVCIDLLGCQTIIITSGPLPKTDQHPQVAPSSHGYLRL